jgi:Fe-S-cluster containining protein
VRRYADPEKQSLADLRALFARVDKEHAGFVCPNRALCCSFAQTGREPYLWHLEWRLLQRRIAERGGRVPPEREDGGCRFLDATGHRCTVYEDRPFGCRTFGCELATGMTRPLREKVRELCKELTGLAETFDPEDGGPRPISRWVGEAK